MSSAQQRTQTVLPHLSPVDSAQQQLLATQQTAQKQCPAIANMQFKAPLRVVVTGAAGNIAYSLLFMLGAGQMAGPHQPLHLVLLDIPAMAKQVEGVLMELLDCAFPLLASITATTDYKEAFTNCDVALLVGAKPRGPGMQRKDLLSANAAIFAGQGKALDAYAKRTVKVCVVGNPANTMSSVMLSNAPSLPASAFTAMTRLDENRAAAQLAQKLGERVTQIHKFTIWGKDKHENDTASECCIRVCERILSRSRSDSLRHRPSHNDSAWLDTSAAAAAVQHHSMLDCSSGPTEVEVVAS